MSGTRSFSQTVQKDNNFKSRPSTASTGKKNVSIVSPKEELVSITPNERNWRGICIALLVIIIVLGLILLFIVILSPRNNLSRNQGIKFTANHVTTAEFKRTPFNGSWISGTELVFRDSTGGLSVLDVVNNTTQLLISNLTFKIANVVDFKVSADRKYVILVSNIHKIHTNTKQAFYQIQEVGTPIRIPLTLLPITDASHHDPPYIQDVVWSPVGNALAFMYQNDIYYKQEAMPSKFIVYRLTYTGSKTVSNGIPEWMYQEEVFKDGKALWFSRDGRYLAYACFNDTLVGEIRYPIYKTDTLYPAIASQYYPKAGTHNPEVSVKIIDLYHVVQNRSHIALKKPKLASSSSEPYLINVVWSGSDEIAVIWLNREQDLFVVSVCFKPLWECQDSHVEKALDTGWIEPSSDIIFSTNGSSFLTILSVNDGIEGRFPHLCHVDIDDRVVTPLTHGRFAVTNVKAWDYKNHVIYFEAAPEGKPTQRHLFNVSDSLIDTNGYKCLTCFIKPSAANNTSEFSNGDRIHNASTETVRTNIHSGRITNTTKKNIDLMDYSLIRTESCLFINTIFPRFQPILYYVLECLGPGVPKTVIMSVVTNSPILLLDNMTELASRYAEMSKPHLKHIKIELERGYEAQVKLLLPPIHTDTLEMEFPFVLFLGSIPGAQSVTDEWVVDWNTYLVTNMNIIVGMIDARGSSCQSDHMKYEINKKIGVVDVEDQLAILTYLSNNMKYIDRNRIGVWGKGYGGYLVGKLLEHDGNELDDRNLIKCGISLAPITNFKYHLSIWTERFMKNPNISDNYQGYDEADLTRRVQHFDKKKYLVIHGTADKKVHYQHSMLLMDALSKRNATFSHLALQTYPDEDHNFLTTQQHIIKEMQEFWYNCFGPVEYEDFDEGLPIPFRDFLRN